MFDIYLTIKHYVWYFIYGDIMDKRIENTIIKIQDAFKKILYSKSYNSITIQEIIKEANIARSTFYAHYETKDDLLKSICKNIFDHVFSHYLQSEQSHDFSDASIFEYTHFITHIFYHIKDEKDFIHAILISEAKSFFVNEIKKELTTFANECLLHQLFKNKNIPNELKFRSIINNFTLLLDYWNDIDFKDSPEKLTEYFLILNN